MVEQYIPYPLIYPIVSTEVSDYQFDHNNIPNLRLINMKEEFRFIDDYTLPNIIPERYMISNFGRVYDRLYNHYVDFLPDQFGYPCFSVSYYVDWNIVDTIMIRVCEAIMRTFNLVPQYQDTIIRHLDGNKNHYYRNNLEWFDPDGLPNHLVETICSRLQSGAALNHLSDMFDIPIEVLKDIRDGRRYQYIRRKYHIEKKKMNILLPGQVREICEMLEKDDNIDSGEIAAKMHCTLKAVNELRAGRSYTRITKDYNFTRIKKETTPILHDDDVRKICELFAQQPDLNNYQIALIFKCKPTQVRDIRLRKVHKDIIKDYHW